MEWYAKTAFPFHLIVSSSTIVSTSCNCHLSCAAWRTGLTLDNVGLRPDAFASSDLPFKLTAGHIGRIQAHVPWKALRAPVIVELSDISISITPLTEEELQQKPAQERAWAAKRACLAAAELQALAGVDPTAASSGEDVKQGGMLWSLLQHVIGMLVNRLQLTVNNVHIMYKVGFIFSTPK